MRVSLFPINLKTNLKIKNTHKEKIQYSKNNNFLNTNPKNYYLYSSISFCAKNTDIIAQMKKELKSKSKNKNEKILKLYTQMSQSAKNNVDGVAEKFKDNGLTKENYILACAKEPSLFRKSADSVEKHINDAVDKFKDKGITIDNYIPVCLIHPPLFYQRLETTEKHINDVVDKFKDKGLTLDNYLTICMLYPQLFSMSSDKIENNINSVVDKFKDNGLTEDDYIAACLKFPSLLYRSPETTENNINDVIDKLKDNGLTLDEYIQACNKQKSLFFRVSDSVENTVKGVVDKFKDKGLTVNDYIQVCIKNPVMFCMSPDTVSQHIDILRFYAYNNNNDIDNSKFWKKTLSNYVDLNYSSSLILIKYIIIPKMFENSEIPKELKRNQLRQKLTEYLKNNPNQKYILNLKKFKTDTDINKILKETLDKLIKDAQIENNPFEINFIE